MGIAIASIFGILFTIFSILLHLACAAAIVILFLMYLNAKSEKDKRRYMTWMILAAIGLVLLLLIRPILLIFGISSLVA